MNPDSNFKERRKSQRFPVERDLKFRVTARKGIEESGTGRTVDMSSGGVLFTTDRLLLPGRRLELSISWPAQLNQQCALRLFAQGRVVRFEDGTAAVAIDHHEFRTERAPSPAPVQPIRPKP